MLWVSTTPGTRSAAAATRSFGRSRPAVGSTCTVTWAGPTRSRTASSTAVHGLVAALQPLQPGDADHHVGEALAPRLAHPHRRAPRARPAPPRTARSISPASPIGARSISTSTLPTRQPHGGHQHEHRDEQRRPGVAAVDARGHQHEADQHRDGAGEVRGEVVGVGDQRRVPAAPALAQRHRRARRVDHQDTAHQRECVPGGIDVVAPRPQPADGLGGDPERCGRQQQRLGQCGQVLGFAMTVLVGCVRRPLGDAHRVQGEHRRRRVERPSERPPPARPGCRWSGPPRASRLRGAGRRRATSAPSAARLTYARLYARLFPSVSLWLRQGGARHELHS